jgi:hypothetical protein
MKNGNYEIHQVTDSAMTKGDRNSSLEMWNAVAHGEFSNDTKIWLQHVATGVLDAESKDAGRLRDSAILRALGLTGVVDKNRGLRQFCDALIAFGCDRKALPEKVRDPRNDGVLGLVHSQYIDIDDVALLKIIDAELVKSKKEWKPKK